MPEGAYRGQFAELEEDDIPECFTPGAMVGQVVQVIEDAAQIVAHRSLDELHRIALRVEAVVAHQAQQLAERRRAEAEADDGDLIFRGMSSDQLAAFVRRMSGDVNLWLAAGAEQAVCPIQTPTLPEPLQRAEYLAAIALWKAVDLRRATTMTARRLRAVSDELLAPAHAGEQDDPASAVWNSPSMRALGSMLDVAQLSAELTRAGTLATEAAYLEERLAYARDHAMAAAMQALQEVANHRLREAAAEGGRRRAAAFEPAKRRIIELARAGKYRSRNAAADGIFEILRGEGAEIKHSFILKTLAAHDRAIEAARQQKSAGR